MLVPELQSKFLRRRTLYLERGGKLQERTQNGRHRGITEIALRASRQGGTGTHQVEEAYLVRRVKAQQTICTPKDVGDDYITFDSSLPSDNVKELLKSAFESEHLLDVWALRY